MSWWVYILECKDKTLYTGITNDIWRRTAQHQAGKASKYTRGRTPVLIAAIYGGFTKGEALKEEYRIKQLPKSEKLKLCWLKNLEKLAKKK